MSSSLSEFDIIKKYFSTQKISRSDVIIGIGDDAALLQPPQDQLLVLTTDSLVENIHFPKQTEAGDIGYKSLAVNLSDLAAMGAEPAWFTLALTLPQVNILWLKQFTEGLFQLANEYHIQLVGGDTTRGPLTITIQAQGFVPPQQALCRRGAKTGDKIYVSGTLGDAGLGLQVALKKLTLPDEAKQFVLQRLNRPTPRISLGKLLRGFASSAIDISDGLLADLNHILESSDVGAKVMANQLPLSSALRDHLPLKEAQRLALTSGDDYELCFTLPVKCEDEIISLLHANRIECTCIGEIIAQPGLEVLGLSEKLSSYGYLHFK